MAEKITVGSGFKNPTIKQDEDGYVYTRLGKLNTYNTSGVFYLSKNPELLYNTPSALLATRLDRQILFGEVGHPDTTGLEGRELVNKLAIIDNNNVCMHIREMDFINTGVSEQGWEEYPIIEMFGWVKPEGIKKAVLEENLYNKHANTLASIRSIITPYNVGAQKVFEVLAISTFDLVTTDGMYGSSKMAGAGLESGFIDDKQLCVDGSCAMKLRNIAAGSEDGEVYEMIADAIDAAKIKTNSIYNF